jgi:hypothetical protein
MFASILLLSTITNHQLSVCDVLRNPSAYRKSLIDIRADVLLALPHGAVLLDENCPNSGIRLGVDLPDAEPSATDLVSSILKDCRSPRPDRIAGVFRGKLAYSANGKIELRLFSVTDLQNNPCTPP